jgi:ribosomal-protein-alanine N-acetyltransferase
MNIYIRKMTVQDIPAVVELDQKSFSLPWPERSFRFELTDNPASRCWVAEWDGKLVGMIVVWLIVDEAHVATLATHPEYRRRGIGKHLLAHALRHMIQDGARGSFLEVRESNLAAQEMYRKFGYEATGRRRHFYRDNDEDAILMNLDSLDPERLTAVKGRSVSNAEEQNER